mmetsp:Transcript_284/g.297  ORF Transcript_284/g.297 Transcript_284/m.297 type:complete len:183 (+) Transcript_284:94-642(+)
MCDVESYFKSPLQDFLPFSNHKTWTEEKKRIQVGKRVLRNPDSGVATFMADLKNPDINISGFYMEAVTLYKNMADSRVLKTKVKWQVDGLLKEAMCGVGYDEILEVVQSCAYFLEPQHEAQVFVKYGAWDPMAIPGQYKIHRRPDYLKVMEDPDKVYRDWIKEQNAARRKMEAELGWDKLGR